MKSTIYQHHLRASASFSYRHLLHCKRGDPNRARLHSTLAYVSPMQFEQDWLANQSRQANS